MWMHVVTHALSLRCVQPIPAAASSSCGRARRQQGGHRRVEGTAQQRQPLQPPVPTSPQQHEILRVLAVTDLHVDYEENLRWCEAIDSEAYRRDVLVVSGDVSDELATLEAALATLAGKFGAVFYTPGNHELWVRERDRAVGVFDSLTKLKLIWEMCLRLGVHTQPRQLGSLWVVPLLSWHHRSWDGEPDIPGVPPPSPWTVSDYSACKWPHSVPGGDSHGSIELAEWFDAMNSTPAWDRLLACRAACDVISFSHFLPHQALLPEKRYLFYPNLTKAVGSVPLAARLRQLRPNIHLFGHTHFAWDARLGSTRYLQAPLCSPMERQKRLFTVGFGATMEQAKADPQGAHWLPLAVYQGLVPAGALEALQGAAQAEAEAAGVAAGAVAGAAVVVAAGAGARGQEVAPLLPAAGSILVSSGGSSSSENAGSGSLQQVQGRQQQGPAVPLVLAEQQLQSTLVVDGWRPLRHGAEAPPLHAHWSEYYVSHQREPEVVTLAPWVADRWTRRRARAAARRSSDGSSSDGSSSERE